MWLLVLIYGIEGDMCLLVMFCYGLIGVGYVVILLVDGGILGSVQVLDVFYVVFEGDIYDEVVVLVLCGNGVVVVSFGLVWMVLQYVSGWMCQVDVVVEGCDVILIGGLVVFVGMSVGECRGMLVMGIGMILLILMWVFCFLFLLLGCLLGWLNCVSYGLVNGLIWCQFCQLINVVCEQLG